MKTFYYRAVGAILQKANNDLVNIKKEDGWTALHLAAGNNNYDSVVLILDQVGFFFQ